MSIIPRIKTILGFLSLTKAQKMICAGCDLEKSHYLAVPRLSHLHRLRDSPLAGNCTDDVREREWTQSLDRRGGSIKVSFCCPTSVSMSDSTPPPASQPARVKDEPEDPAKYGPLGTVRDKDCSLGGVERVWGRGAQLCGCWGEGSWGSSTKRALRTWPLCSRPARCGLQASHSLHLSGVT